jgi:hypothetical protein
MLITGAWVTRWYCGGALWSMVILIVMLNLHILKAQPRSLKSHINRQYNGKKGQKDKPMIYKTLYRKVKI